MCSAAQRRRAAKWGQGADSLPKWVRMRRPIALGGDGNPFTANQRLAVTPQRGAPSSRHEPPRAARRRALSQAAATAASAAPPPPRPLHRRRFSARMLPALAISSSPSARPSQRARPKNRHRARVRGWHGRIDVCMYALQGVHTRAANCMYRMGVLVLPMQVGSTVHLYYIDSG